MSKELTVKKLTAKDANSGMVRIHSSVMEEMGLEVGQVVEIEGRSVAAARVQRHYKNDRNNPNVIRMDGDIRNSLEVSIDDVVTVEKAEADPADKVTVVQATDPGRGLIFGGGNITGLIKRELQEHAVMEGQVFRLNRIASFMGFRVQETIPDSPVIIGRDTDVVMGDPERMSQTKSSSEIPDVTYEDVGGLNDEIEEVREMVELPMKHPEVFERLGIEPPKGLLLHGPPGTGKTLLAKAVANEVNANFQSLSGPEIMSKFYGESESQLREVFEEAEKNSPSIIFIDEIDSIAPSRDEVTGEQERRVVAQLLSLMDGLESRGKVIVIAATNRVDAVDSALRRGGRFDRELEIGVPDRDERLEILQIHSRGMPLEGVNLEEYADKTYGYVGADIATLTKEAAMSALNRVKPELNLEEDEIPPEVIEQLEVLDQDFEEAMKTIEPSAMREVFVEVPDVTYEEVGGLDEVKQNLIESVEWPLQYEQVFDDMGAEAPKGILMYGPPGTGKTLLAKAVANASDSNFITVKGPELLNKYVGESEKGVREIFKKAKQNAPTVIFFDEIDALAPERGGSSDNQVTERVVSQLLTEMDGIEELENVKIIAATNRPDLIDSALLRPGRLDSMVEVPVPDEEAREEILKIHTRDIPLSDEIDFDELVDKTDGYTGSDIEALSNKANMIAIRSFIKEAEGDVDGVDEDTKVTMNDFDEALEEVKPSVDEDTLEMYERMSEKMKRGSTEADKDRNRAFK